jgi:hypothetical protein
MLERPFKLFGAHERAAMAALLEARVAAWAGAWLPEGVELQLEIGPAAEVEPRMADASGWSRYAAPNGDAVALRVQERDLAELAAALCGAGEGRRGRTFAGVSALSEHVGGAALRELASGLLEAKSVSVAQGALEDAWLPYSAAYAAEIALGAARIAMVASGTWALRMLKEKLPRPAPARLIDRRSAMSAQTLRLHAVAGWAELDLGVVQALAVGNVIALEVRLDRPMTLATASGTPLCSARLGLLDGRKAVCLGLPN